MNGCSFDFPRDRCNFAKHAPGILYRAWQALRRRVGDFRGSALNVEYLLAASRFHAEEKVLEGGSERTNIREK